MQPEWTWVQHFFVYWLFLTPALLQHIFKISPVFLLLLTIADSSHKNGAFADAVLQPCISTRQSHAAGDVNSAVASCVRAQQPPPDRKWHHNSDDDNDNDDDGDCSDHTAVFACFNLFTADCLYFTLLANIFQPSRHQLVEFVRWCQCVFYVRPAETWNMPELRASSQ